MWEQCFMQFHTRKYRMQVVNFNEHSKRHEVRYRETYWKHGIHNTYIACKAPVLTLLTFTSNSMVSSILFPRYSWSVVQNNVCCYYKNIMRCERQAIWNNLRWALRPMAYPNISMSCILFELVLYCVISN